MLLQVVVYVLTALAALVVVLTRERLTRSGRAAGHVAVPHRVVDVHTVVGALATVVWLVYLVAPDDTVAGGDGVGIVALGCWWVVALAGLLILVRWLPSRGRHVAARPGGGLRGWAGGPGLSLLAHVGMVVAVVVFTWAYGQAAV